MNHLLNLNSYMNTFPIHFHHDNLLYHSHLLRFSLLLDCPSLPTCRLTVPTPCRSLPRTLNLHFRALKTMFSDRAVPNNLVLGVTATQVINFLVVAHRVPCRGCCGGNVI
jgi:hypothetical protein